MTVLLYVAVTLVLVVVGVLLVASRQPETFRVERSAVMAAPAAAIFPLINDLRAWQTWSPWVALDPACVYTYGGAEAGEGATAHWVGNRKAGEGRMTILDSRPGQLVTIKLEFVKPFKATNTAEFTLAEGEGNTHVSWAMFGDKNLISKAMGMVKSMDKMIGPDFERGLAKMKTVAEGDRLSI